MLLRIFCFLLLSLVAAAVPVDGFPPDPNGVTISDRVYEDVSLDGKNFSIYAVVVRDKQGIRVQIYSGQDVQKGMEWKRLYTWKFQDQLKKEATLRVAAGPQGDIQFWFEQWFAYVEGRAKRVLRYEVRTGKFTEDVVD